MSKQTSKKIWQKIRLILGSKICTLLDAVAHQITFHHEESDLNLASLSQNLYWFCWLLMRKSYITPK